MDTPKSLQNTNLQKEFWDSLQSDIIISNQKITRDNISAFVEQNFMFSLFFRGSSQVELITFKHLFNIGDSAFMTIVELQPKGKPSNAEIDIDSYGLYSFIKLFLSDKAINTVGPLITNRIGIVISVESDSTANTDYKKAVDIVKALIDELQIRFNVSAFAGIGNVQKINSLYTSFIEALACIHRCIPGQVMHIEELGDVENLYHYEYLEAEKHMLDAIRLRKVKSYDYFVIMMDLLGPLNDVAKRNKIIETIVLAAHAAQADGSGEADYFNYIGQIPRLMELKGNEIIEWAYQIFMKITGFVKPQNSIDYSNRVVQATKEYLEAHYAEEITLENIAEIVNVSPQYFSKLIKKNTGFNFIDWLSMLRVKKAKELLTNSNYTVKEVCFMVGYKDPNYFSRIFKKKMGITPSEYINNRVY